MALIEILSDDLELENIELPDVMLVNDISEGDAKRIILRNAGISTVFELVVNLEGEGREHVQLAREEEDGALGVWAAPGESIVAFTGSLQPGAEAHFWARGIYSLEDLERRLRFKFIVITVSG